MAEHSIYIGKSMEVRSGSSPLCGLENRRPKGYAGSSPVPSAISILRGLKNNRSPKGYSDLNPARENLACTLSRRYDKHAIETNW